MTVGPMLACAVGDAYGAGFEHVHLTHVRELNDLSYHAHPKWSAQTKNFGLGIYTDDTQMALGLAEHIIEGDDLNQIALARRWLTTFKRDQRTGYNGGFHKILSDATSGAELMAALSPLSTKNGAAMRAFPAGLLVNPHAVIGVSMLQASTTHSSLSGVMSASAAALMFNYFYYRRGTKEELVDFINSQLSTDLFDDDWTGNVGNDGIDTVNAAITAVVKGQTLSHTLRTAIGFTGDVDTVAAIAMPSAAVCDDIVQDLPRHLIDGLENGTFGRDHIKKIDVQIAQMFPRQTGRR